MSNLESIPVFGSEEQIDPDLEATRYDMCSPCDKPCPHLEIEGPDAWIKCYDERGGME